MTSTATAAELAELAELNARYQERMASEAAAAAARLLAPPPAPINVAWTTANAETVAALTAGILGTPAVMTPAHPTRGGNAFLVPEHQFDAVYLAFWNAGHAMEWEGHYSA